LQIWQREPVCGFAAKRRARGLSFSKPPLGVGTLAAALGEGHISVSKGIILDR